MLRSSVLVCGGRIYGDTKLVFDTLDNINDIKPISMIVHGGAGKLVNGILVGADVIGGVWAASRGIECRVEMPDWNMGRGAGPIRNQRMIDRHRPRLIVAFPGGKGTADMVRRGEQADIPIWKVT